jgi:ABC-type sugar transport system substrate-binding protein
LEKKVHAEHNQGYKPPVSAIVNRRKEIKMKIRRRIPLLLLILTMVVALTACGGGSGDASDSDAEEPAASEEGTETAPPEGGEATGAPAYANDFHIAYAAVTTSLAPWVVELANNFEEMCTRNGWKYDIYDGEGNPSVQTEQINSIISDGEVDLVVLFPVDSEVGVQYVQDLKAAGIDVITMGSDVSEAGQADVKYFVGPDNVGMINFATQYIKDTLGTEEALNYVILSGFDMQYDYIVREKATNDAFADTPYKQLDVSYCGASRDQAMEDMAGYLTAYDDIDFVICHSDEFALGAEKAIEAAGKTGEIVIASVECFQASIPLIKEGKIGISVTMTGKNTVLKLEEVLLAHLNGEDLGDHNQYSTVEPVTKDNADSVAPEY